MVKCLTYFENYYLDYELDVTTIGIYAIMNLFSIG